MRINYSSKDYFNLFGHTLSGASLSNWFSILHAQRAKIDYAYLPKIGVMSVPILFNYPIQRYEALRFNRRIKATKITSPVFILGHFRSGTTFLHEVLCCDPQFAYCTTNQALNPLTFLTTGGLTKFFIKKFLPDRRPMDNMPLKIDQPMEEEFALACLSQASLAHGFYYPKDSYSIFDNYVLFRGDKSHLTDWKKTFDFFTKKIAFSNPDKTILFKSPGNTARVKEILELYPDARFIHIHRHPLEVYQSTIRLFEKVLPLHAFQRVEESFMHDYILYSYEKMYDKFMFDSKGLKPSQLIEISYDDFNSNPMQQLSSIYDQLNIKNFSSIKNNFETEISSRKAYQKNSYAILSKERRSTIYQRWKIVFDKYQYKLGD